MGGGELGHFAAGFSEDDLRAEASDSGNGGEVGQVLLPVGQQGCDPGIEGGDDALPAVDLVQVVPDHERVVVGELAVQGIDEGGNLIAGPPPG
ncbi:hypothetical protein [Streptomyces lunaelactis]|uniref:hypothetical protein n=1 Tax=Streptomyces lunaelactis TaxID=1535768 RepID=UPI0020C768AC|nr:hypothetical protein [Streptomyces lunaelactis]